MASKSKREKQLAAQKAARQQARREQEAARRRKRMGAVSVVTIVALLVASGIGVGWLLTKDSDSDEPDVTAASCQYNAVEGPVEVDVGLPPSTPAVTGPATATITINGEPIVVDLDTAGVPCTVNSWHHLAAADFFNESPCHRLTTSDTLQVLQCGDPTGTGAGGPGYRYADESLQTANYTAGTIAMANTGEDSNGSQFFIVYGDSSLPPSYTVVGSVVSGLDVVTEIADAGVQGGGEDGMPATEAVLNGIEVTSS